MKELLRKFILWLFHAEVRFKRLKPTALLPAKVSTGSAAYDAFIPSSVKVKYGTQIIPLGWACEMPGYLKLNCRPRSGYTAKGLLVYDKDGSEVRLQKTIVQLGLIDSDYRGEMGIILSCYDYRVGTMDLHLNAEQAVAQLEFAFCPSTDVVEVQEIGITERGTSGFGKLNNE